MSQGPGTMPPAATALPTFSRILLVTDFSSYSEAAVPFARLLASYYKAKITVAHAVPPEQKTEAAAAASDDAARATAEEHMQGFLEQHALRGVDVVVESGPVADVLGGVIQQKNIDLVVLGTHGRSGMGKLVLGSIAQRIFEIAQCPVLSVSPRAASAGEKLSRILYATDLSDDSLKALPYALSLARRSGAELLFVSAVDEVPEGAFGQKVITEHHQRLSALIPSSMTSDYKFDTLVFPGDPAKVILNAAAEHRADLIVIGSHPIQGPFYRVNVPLSTAYQIVAHAHCPVLRVRVAH